MFLSWFFLYYILLYLIEISMWWIILWILTFIILVVLHELWHFTAAKKSWVHVKEFWLWIPPRAKTLWKDKSWTAYTLNWIPLGWFVVLKWEDGTDEKENMDPDCFIKAKLWKKLVIIVAWVAMNFLTAWVLFTIAFSVWMQPMSVLPDGYMWLYSESYVTPSVGFLEEKWFISEEYAKWDVIVKQVIEGSIAQDIWLEDWTKIVSINWEAVSPKNLSTQLSEIQSWEVNNISYQLAWAETTIESEFVCWEPCVLWVMYDSYEIPTIKFSVPRAMREALKEIKAEWNLTMDNLARIWHLIWAWESKQAINSLSGPVAIVKVGQLLFDNLGFLSFLWFAWMISVALAIMNILPIPALDWWRFWALIIQKVFRFKEDKFFNIEAWVDTIFFWCLMLMWIIIILKDLSFRWINIPFLS